MEAGGEATVAACGPGPLTESDATREADRPTETTAPDPRAPVPNHGREAGARAVATCRRRAERHRRSGLPAQTAPARSEAVPPRVGSRSPGRDSDRRLGRMARPHVSARGGPGLSPERHRATAGGERRGPLTKAGGGADRWDRRAAGRGGQGVLARVRPSAPR